MTSFRVGQKVVFVNDSSDPKKATTAIFDKEVAIRAGAVYPNIGKVYTIRSIVYRSGDDMPLLLLREIDNSTASNVLGYIKEAGFAAWRFRPVVERKTDISIFQAMLNTTKEPANV